LRYVCPS